MARMAPTEQMTLVDKLFISSGLVRVNFELLVGIFLVMSVGEIGHDDEKQTDSTHKVLEC